MVCGANIRGGSEAMNTKLTFFPLFLFLVTFSVCSENGMAALAKNDAAEIRNIGRKEPLFMDALFPELKANGTTITLSSVPGKVISHAKSWIKILVRKEWLPVSLDESTSALKDTILLELKGINGVVFTTIGGDYIYADYLKKEHHLSIQENGIYISICIDMPEPINISKITNDNIKEFIVKYINVSKEELSSLSINMIQSGTIIYGAAQRPSFSISEDGRAMTDTPKYWRDKIFYLTNGKFLFLSVVERDGTPVHFQNRPGMPDRF